MLARGGEWDTLIQHRWELVKSEGRRERREGRNKRRDRKEREGCAVNKGEQRVDRRAAEGK